jgi:cell division septum initiation protein DivIVA
MTTQKKRIRYGVKAMAAMREEITIRNQAIEQLEADVQTYLSEKSRLGETNAWLTEQNDALKKEVAAANESHEMQHNKSLQYQRMYETYRKEASDLFNENASNAMKAYIFKAVAITLFVVNCILGGLLVVG